MDILRYNNITKSIDVICTFDTYTDIDIPSGINVYNSKFMKKLQSYMNKLIENTASIISSVKTDYESSQIFEVNDAKSFSVSDDSGSKILEIMKDGSDFIVKINKEIIVSGITIGVFGYAIGNFLGVFFAYLLKSL